ncbi:MAG: RNA polymerase sigma factor [Sphingobacteriaceae bacterium]
MLIDEKKLLALVAGGDEAAFAVLFSQYRNKIYSVAFKLTRSIVLAEETVQEVFLIIWLRRETLNGVLNFSDYLFIVTRNQVFKVLKQIAREYKINAASLANQAAGHNDTEDKIIGKEFRLLLENAVDLLPTQQKQVYRLIKEQGLKRDEVAGEMKLQPETVKFHLAQAMKSIRTFCLPHLYLFTYLTLYCGV